MMRKDWGYSDAATSHCGLMICSSCGKPVTGQYRWREKTDRYVVQHRECTASDPSWARLDANAVQQLEHSRALLRACLEFREKWGVSELDDLIDEIEGRS